MQILLSFPERASLDSTTLPNVSVQLVDGGPRILVVEPASWSAIGIYFLGKLADSFVEATGKELGRAFGSWLAGRLGFGTGPTEGDIKRMLDNFVKEISAILREQFHEQQYREAHELLAGASRQLSDFLIAPSTESLDSLNALDLATGTVYEKIKNLGPTAIPSLCRAGVILITVAVRKYGITKDEGVKTIALARIAEVSEDLAQFVSKISEIYSRRTSGPYDATYTGYCIDLTPPGEVTFTTEPNRIGRYYSVSVPAIGITIDGVQSRFELKSNHCNRAIDRQEIATNEANAALAAGKARIHAELQSSFLDPLTALLAKANDLRNQLEKDSI